MKFYYIYILVSLTLILAIGGCSIEESPTAGNRPEGSVHVTAFDDLGNLLDGALITVDDAVQPERVPAYLHGIPAGTRRITVEEFGYWADETTIEMVAGDTAEVSMTLETVSADEIGFLSFTSQPSGGRLLVEGREFSLDNINFPSPSVIPLRWGEHTIAAHLADHATVAPILPTIRISAAETTMVDFSFSPNVQALEAGSLPLDFTLENVSGDSIRLTDLTGYVVMINFWYVDCDPCREEFDDIQRVYERHQADGYRVLAIDPMYRDDRARVEAFGIEYGLTFQLLLDWEARVASGMYRMTNYPSNVIIDRTGVIHDIKRGITEDELEAVIVELLGA